MSSLLDQGKNKSRNPVSLTSMDILISVRDEL
jgi:hypothetical protein